MSAPEESRGEPKPAFVPLWSDDEGDLPERVIAVREPTPVRAEAPPAPPWEPVPGPEPAREPEPEPPRELRPEPPKEPVRTPAPARARPARPSAARWAVAKVRAAGGLLLLVLLAGVLLAAAVGLTVAGLALALRSAGGTG
ncbi:MAG TPA: hypothetical protein VM933_00835 [Acidimicrobiales bacterium]|nr:hypothetical protein [Acidimicrobiales bacterium]